jgi:hypothetical protein
MSIATALVTGNEATPLMAETAVRQALARAGLTTANGVLLFLTPDFARQAQACVTAAARAASCLQVAGGIAAGVFTEDGWVLDRPAAAAMVFGDGFSLAPADDGSESPATLFSFTGGTLPAEWRQLPQRFGGSFNGGVGSGAPAVWHGGRVSPAQRCTLAIGGARVEVGVSSGLRLLAPAQRVEAVCAYDVEEVGQRSAFASLLRALPPAWRDNCVACDTASLPLHQLCAVLIDDDAGGDAHAALAAGRFRPVAIVAANIDESLTLAERTQAGQRLAWAIREPATCAADMRRSLARLAADNSEAAAALAFSCIGRGPYFYGREDEDLGLFASYFPGLPLLGVYGTGQLAPGCDGANRQLQNSVVAALLSRQQESFDVQPDA